MITPMKKVFVAGREADRPDVLSVLQEAGVMHVVPVDAGAMKPTIEVNQDIERAERAIGGLAEVQTEGSPLEYPGTPSRLVDEYYELSERVQWNAAMQAETQKKIQDTALWGALDIESLDVLRRNGLTIKFCLGTSDAVRAIEADAMQVVREESGMAYTIVASRSPIGLPPGVNEIPAPMREARDLEQDLEKLKAEKRDLLESLQRIRLRLPDIQTYLTDLRERKRFQEVEMGLLAEGPIFVCTGWVPVDAISDLEGRLLKSGKRVALQAADPDDEDAPPTKFLNAAWCKPIEALYGAFGVFPGYREPDISQYFLPFLALFTAMLIGDGGYAVIGLAVLGSIYRPAVRNGVPAQFLQLFMILFGATFVFGALTNTWFGTQVSFLKGLMAIDPGTPAGENILKKLCFAIGGLHLTIAHVWKTIRKPQVVEAASLAEVGWIIFIWSIFDLVNFLVLGETLPGRTLPMIYVALGLVLFFSSPSWNPLAAAWSGAGVIALNAAAFLSDIISYIRLWAVGYAGGILASSFNSMIGGIWSYESFQPAPMVVAALLFIAAHLLNFGLGLVAIFAHGVRLNLLEFSNHLGIEWVGKPYDPFRRLSGGEPAAGSEKNL
ncbi:MAG TPA: hypothetical protein PKO06_12255 [Candidatus Ozemobacteraceae bacterium]|nr:hypothetical protein [Candidatus Ozemobacteraceae bacterium]